MHIKIFIIGLCALLILNFFFKKYRIILFKADICFWRITYHSVKYLLFATLDLNGLRMYN